jgi:hypothetical protein
MKIKSDFVTNSSSASFIIGLHNITHLQKILIYNHVYFCKYEGIEGFGDFHLDEGDAWEIKETEDYIEGSTIIDNFNMHEYLKIIGVDMNKVKYWHS